MVYTKSEREAHTARGGVHGNFLQASELLIVSGVMLIPIVLSGLFFVRMVGSFVHFGEPRWKREVRALVRSHQFQMLDADARKTAIDRLMKLVRPDSWAAATPERKEQFYNEAIQRFGYNGDFSASVEQDGVLSVLALAVAVSLGLITSGILLLLRRKTDQGPSA